MNRDHALAVLREQANAIRAKGVVRLALFGSVVRDEVRPDSDVDLLVDYDENRSLSLLDIASLQQFLSVLLGREVELADRRYLKSFVKTEILAEAVEIFPCFGHRISESVRTQPSHRRPRQTLQDILDETLLIKRHVAGVTLDQFRQDDCLRFAVEREVEVIADAVRRLPIGLLRGHGDIPWDRFRAMGDDLRCNYDDDHSEAVWEIATHYLKPLEHAVEALIAQIDESAKA